jgi:hypothetical protein
MAAANDGFPYLFTAGCSDIISLAGLLTYPCLQRLPLFKEWLCAANLCAGLTAAGTVADSLLFCGQQATAFPFNSYPPEAYLAETNVHPKVQKNCFGSTLRFIYYRNNIYHSIFFAKPGLKS